MKSSRNQANVLLHSPGQYWQLLYKTKISLPATMAHLPIAAVPTRMTRASTKTFRPILNQKSARSLILTIRVVVQTATLRWTMRTAMVGQRQQYQNAQRRSRRQRNCEVAFVSRSLRQEHGAKDFGMVPKLRNGFPRFSRGSNVPWD